MRKKEISKEEPKIVYTTYLGKTKINVVDVSPKTPEEREELRKHLGIICSKLLEEERIAREAKKH